MTLGELNEHYLLRTRLTREEALLASLYGSASPSSMHYGNARPAAKDDRVGNLAAEIADLESHIGCIRKEVETREMSIRAYICGIDDGMLRTIMRLRFLQCLPWGKVAMLIGGKNTESGVKAAAYRHISG